MMHGSEKDLEPIGPLQLRVMLHIWKMGPSTVHDVINAINGNMETRSLAYTTLLTVLRNLAKRGMLEQIRGERAHRFVPLIDERTYKLTMVRQMRQVLGDGNIDVLLQYLAEDEELPPEMRQRLQACVESK